MKKNSVNSKFDWEKFKEKLEYVKSSIDPRYLVENLGFNISRETPKELRAFCIIHGGDNKTAFRFNKEKRSWVCFTHKCHEIFGTDIIGLIKAVKNCEFREAVEYLMSVSGDTVASEVEILNYKIKKEREDFLKDYKKKPVNSSIVNEECLKQFMPFRSKSFIQDGFKKETLDFFEIAGGYTDSFNILRDIITIRDENSKLVAYSMRDIRRDIEDDDDFKYLLTKYFNKDRILYNLHNAKNYIEDGKLIIVEGFKSVWKLYECGILNVVATMGSGITPGQENLLYKYAINTIIMFYDCDEAGISATIKTYKDFKSKIEVIPVFIAEEGKDPADLDKQNIQNYLKGYF